MKKWSQYITPAIGVVVGCLGISHAARAAAEKVIYSFDTQKVGQFPSGSLVNLNNRLFGSISSGGPGGCGSIFKVAHSGYEKTLYACQAGGTGASGLVKFNGILFGIGSVAGASGEPGLGTFFSITPQGTYTPLYAFSSQDGSGPIGRLIVVNGVFYGVTAAGGSNGCGTLFSITPQGQFSSLYSFTGANGCYPRGGLTAIGGSLYGVTSFGGTDYNGKANSGRGVVFSYAPGGAETVLHAFGSAEQGRTPTGDLLAVGSDLYGTTISGGHHDGGGTVFSLKLNGAYKVLHSFGPFSGTDGVEPNGGLILFRGVIYGTTQAGGSNHEGAVFSVTRGGIETVIYSLDTEQGDGQTPDGGLVTSGGVLYGTTFSGGASKQCNQFGCGTVFSITP